MLISFWTRATSRVVCKSLTRGPSEYLVIALPPSISRSRAHDAPPFERSSGRSVLVAERGQWNSLFEGVLSPPPASIVPTPCGRGGRLPTCLSCGGELFARPHRQTHRALESNSSSGRAAARWYRVRQPRAPSNAFFWRPFSGCGCDSTTASRAAGDGRFVTARACLAPRPASGTTALVRSLHVRCSRTASNGIDVRLWHVLGVLLEVASAGRSIH